MKVLHLLASPVWSGPAENVALLAAAQRALGHQVTVAVDRKRTQLHSEEPLVPRLRELELLDEGGLELSVKSSPMAIWRDVRRLAGRALDVVHAHFSHDHLIARFGAPRGARLVRSLHAPRSLRWSLPRAEAFTVSTSKEAASLPNARVLVLPALVGPAFQRAADGAALRQALGLSGEPLIGMASTFQATRRHALALQALAHLREQRPGARLVLIGDGALEGALRIQVRQLGLEGAVHFAGYQQGEAFVRHLQSLDELWVLGLGNDFSARVAAQARACGVRVLAVADGALPGLADVLLEAPTAAHLVTASLGGHRREVAMPSNEETARAVLALYEGACP